MEKCFKKLQFGCYVFLGPNGFLVHKYHEKAKMHSVSMQTDMSNENTKIEASVPLQTESATEAFGGIAFYFKSTNYYYNINN